MLWGKDKKRAEKPSFYSIKPSDFAGLEARIKSKNTVLLIHATWCMHCVMFTPKYSAFAKTVKSTKRNVQVLALESTVMKTLHETDKKLFAFVTGFKGGDMYFPKVMTFKVTGDRVVRKEYQGERTEKDLLAFTDKNLVAAAPVVKAAPVARKAMATMNEQLMGAPHQRRQQQS